MPETEYRYYQLYDSYDDNYGIIRTKLNSKEINDIMKEIRETLPNTYTDMDVSDFMKNDDWEWIGIEKVYF